jgi:hypothetical protein
MKGSSTHSSLTCSVMASVGPDGRRLRPDIATRLTIHSRPHHRDSTLSLRTARGVVQQPPHTTTFRFPNRFVSSSWILAAGRGTTQLNRSPASQIAFKLTLTTIFSARSTIQQGQPSFVGPLHGERACVELLTDKNHPIFDDPGFDTPRPMVSQFAGVERGMLVDSPHQLGSR